MPWTTEQRIFIVEAYFRQKSIHAAVPDFLDNAWCSDEAHFLLSGHVNSKNNIIGPFWFEDDNKRSVTINTERYAQVLGKFWTALGRRKGVVSILQWFQQDGATPTPPTNQWHGYSSVSLTDWSTAGVTRSGRRIHRTCKPPRFLYLGIP